jgi:hypothetical protein
MSSALRSVEKPVALIELVLKLLWGLSAGEQRPPQVILDSGNRRAR